MPPRRQTFLGCAGIYFEIDASRALAVERSISDCIQRCGLVEKLTSSRCHKPGTWAHICLFLGISQLSRRSPTTFAITTSPPRDVVASLARSSAGLKNTEERRVSRDHYLAVCLQGAAVVGNAASLRKEKTKKSSKKWTSRERDETL